MEFIGTSERKRSVPPAMFLPAHRPCMAAWGKMRYGPVQSPAAYTWGRLVFMAGSVTMLRSAAPPASLSRTVLGRTPTASTSTSNSTVSPPVSRAVCSVNSSTVFPSLKAIPFCSRCASTRAALSVCKMLESTCGAKSQTVISFARPWSPSAAFRPISPPPRINTRLSGVTACFRAWASERVRKENFFPTRSSPFMGGTKGTEPVQRQSSS